MSQTINTTLPPLTVAEQAHSSQLIALIRAEIASNAGWISFARYMELALYAPGLGYYSAGAHKLGVGGDFITAPEISPLFSRCVANQIAAVLQTLPAGEVLELGAGTGVMVADMLLQLEMLNVLPAHYYVLEVSADLRQRQQALLQQRVPHLFHTVTWLQTLPTDFIGCIVANEVLDALPVQRFCVASGAVQELGVRCDDKGFNWQARLADAKLREAVQAIAGNLQHELAEGYCSEVNLALPAWIKSIASSMQRGVMLYIDYGLPQRQYYSVDRSQGTLACFYKHHTHNDPFTHVGLQDLTAWVDFTALAEAGIAAGLELQGFATQAHFLLGAGLEPMLNALMSVDSLTDTQRWQLSQQVQQLMLPDGMGESFKAMAFSKDCDVQPLGFSIRDLRHSL